MKRLFISAIFILWFDFAYGQASSPASYEIKTGTDFRSFLVNHSLQINLHADGIVSIFYIEFCDCHYAVSVNHETGEVFISKDGQQESQSTLQRLSGWIERLQQEGNLVQEVRYNLIVYSRPCPS